VKRYRVNEVFGPTLQGEGARAGSVNWWLRFAGCNLTCSRDGEAGFDCDTDFSGGRLLDAPQVLDALLALVPERFAHRERWLVVSGGEPGMQLDDDLVRVLRAPPGFRVAVETNGTYSLPEVDWVSCSPKTAEHTLRLGRKVDELRYVRHVGQALPKPALEADHYFVSPAFEADGSLRRETLDWCVRLCLDNPRWRLSVQQHKLWRVR
jgi:organic radical activating enzyme